MTITFTMLKVAIVGCGKIADQHVQAIRRIPDCQIVALCDRELLMAAQLGERFGIAQCFSDAGRNAAGSLAECRSHHNSAAEPFCSARAMPRSRRHVYLEKPFTVTSQEAKTLMQLAENCGVKSPPGIICNSRSRCWKCAGS